MTMSFSQNVRSAFKKLGAVVLITATLAVFFIACNQTSGGGNTGGGGGKPTPTPKHAINFSVDSTTPNGMLKAKADGVDETSTSPINVEQDKTVTCTATANAGYKVGKWTVTPAEALQAGTGADESETAKVKITADASVSVSFELNPVKGGAVLILNPDNLTINVKAKTEDGSAITVEGCEETTLENDKGAELHAKGTVVTLKGKITELSCSDNELTALGVRELTALQNLDCYNNKIKAEEMTKLLKALPARKASDDAKVTLYTEKTEPAEENCKDYSKPKDLKTAFEDARGRHWKLQKEKPDGTEVDI